jgi:GxxExxY protein
MDHKYITEKIIGCAFRVYNKMGFGYLETVYEKCMVIELRKASLKAESQKLIIVYYDNEIVGEFIADILVDDEIIVELKSILKINKKHEAQLVNYLVATKKEIGLLINFADEEVQVKRKTRVLKK